jgi:hypothetical protein
LRIEGGFSRAAFEAAEPSARVELCGELSQALREWLTIALDFHQTCYELIGELREKGHDLWSLDESDEFQVWGPNYQEGVTRGLLIRFTSDREVTAEWHE